MAPRTDIGAWMKFFPQDWLGGTRMLPPLARAAYIDLLCFAWEHGSIPDNPRLLAGFCGMTFEDFAEAWKHLRCKWELHPTETGKLVNAKEERVRVEQQGRVDQRRDAARERWSKVPPEERSRIMAERGRQSGAARRERTNERRACDARSPHAQRTCDEREDSGLRTQRERGGDGDSLGDLAVKLADETIKAHRVDSGRRHEIEPIYLAHLKTLVSARARPEDAVRALESGIARCAEKAREQAPTNPIGKLWHKLRGDGGDDLGGLVQDAVAELEGGGR